MLLFIKPSFVNELNEGEARDPSSLLPSPLTTPASPDFQPFPLPPRDHFSRDAGTSPEDPCEDFFRSDYPPNSHFAGAVKVGFAEDASLEDWSCGLNFDSAGGGGSVKMRERAPGIPLDLSTALQTAEEIV